MNVDMPFSTFHSEDGNKEGMVVDLSRSAQMSIVSNTQVIRWGRMRLRSERQTSFITSSEGVRLPLIQFADSIFPSHQLK